MKSKSLKIINILLMLDFLLIATTAFLHDLIMPLGLYSLLHAFPGFLFVALVISHVVLNRAWIKQTYFPKNK